MFFSTFGISNFLSQLKQLFLIFIVTIFCLPAQTQSTSFEQKITFLDSVHFTDPREKIFIHYDKPYYQVKDTLWLKGYIVTATDHSPNDSSRIVYVEIINSQNNVVKRLNPVCMWGIFSSHIVLHNSDYAQGEYLLRAYTQRMRNYSDSLFFVSRFKIIDPALPDWRMNFKNLVITDGKLQLSAAVLRDANLTAKKQDLSIRVFSKNKTVLKTDVKPDSFGNLYIDTLLQNTDNQPLEIEIADKDNMKLRLPVPAVHNKPDIQFLPEGGLLLQNKIQRLGFKAVNSLGKSVETRGVIKDDKDSSIARFETIHKGMGAVVLNPQPGRTYTAFTDAGYSFPLPVAVASGHLLQVKNDSAADSIYLKIDATADLKNQWIYFTATTRGIVRAWGRKKIKEEPFEVALDKKQFPSGITVFTLYNEKYLPVNERAVFIWHRDVLNIEVATHKPVYENRDSVSLSLLVQDENGAAAMGSFSLSVIDTSQVRIKTHQENLLTYMLLGSDLKGAIEDPHFYVTDSAGNAADVLMLTQGWVSYKDSNLNRPFAYEKDFSLQGRVSNVFNKPLSKSSITLFGKVGKNDMFLMDTSTNENGQFVFTDFPIFDTDTVSMVIKALNKRGKAFNVGIELNEPSYPSTSNYNYILANAAMLTTDTIAKNFTVHQKQLESELKKDGIYLKEVIVTGRVKIAGSKNLNSDGGADQVINESTLEKTPKESLVDVLQQQVKGFRVGTLPRSNMQRYMVHSNMARFIIDGVDLEFFYQASESASSMDYLLFNKGFLSYFAAEDIKAIEVMNTPRYNGSYRSRFLTPAELIGTGPAKIDFSFIEITTHSGSGPFMKKTPGMYLLKPMYPFISKQFYSPRYTSPEDRPVFADLRTTVYWNANIITDTTGKAQLSFYTSESKSNYMMVIQGTDLKGRFGVLYKPLMIEQKAVSD